MKNKISFILWFIFYIFSMVFFIYGFLYLEVATHESAHSQVLKVWGITNLSIEYNLNPFNNKSWAGRVVYSETENATCTENCKLALAELHNFSPYIQSFGTAIISFFITQSFINILVNKFKNE